MSAALSPTQWRDVALLDVALLDPAGLAAHPRNVRADLGDLTGLTASIAAQGVIEPLTVIVLADGSHQLVAGHRRAAAAVAAGLGRVPCVIRRDLSIDVDTDHVQAEHVGAMLAENLQRADLTVVEEARGVQTMLDLGVDLDTVVARTGLDRKRAVKAAGVARLAPAAAAAVSAAGLTLDQAAVVARFEDDEDLVDELVVAAGEGPGEFAHAVTRAEQDRQSAEQLAAARVRLEGQGRTVLVDDTEATRLSQLLHHGELLTRETHASCPGSAVLLTRDVWGELLETELCIDPAGNGHTNRWGQTPSAAAGSSMSDEEVERQRAERRQVIENNKAMSAANTTRRAWVREYLARRNAPKGALRFAVEAIATYADELHAWLSSMDTQEARDAHLQLGLAKPSRWTRTDVTLTSGEHVADGRLTSQLLAHVAAAIEGATTKESWRRDGVDRERLATWLTFLAGQGYTLAAVEQLIVDGADR